MRSNAHIAGVFREMSDLVRLRSGPSATFRARAFRNVAKIIETTTGSVTDALCSGTLQQRRGVGPGSVDRIKQILRTGTCDDHQRLRASFPPGVVDLLKLRGLGPSRVRMIVQHLGIGSVDELELAARSGSLTRLPGLGERTVSQLMASLAHHRRSIASLSLGRGLALARDMRDQLRGDNDHTVEIVGSLRRGCEVVGDLDFIAASSQPAAVVARFCQLDQLDEVIARGATAASARLSGGQQVDIWVVTPDELGAALHAYSGSQQHVVALRERAVRRGLHISEHGIFRRAGGQRVVATPSERDIFAAVGLPFVPPELREHGGELEAAERGTLPRLVEQRHLRGDLHLHTTDSDGLATASQMADAARDLGLSYIAVSDHSRSTTVANGLDEPRLLAQQRRLRELEQHRGDIRLLSGVEVDILPDGSLDLDRAVLAELDWVTASVHSSLGMSAEQMTRRLVRAIESGVVDCLGHPRGRRLGTRDGYDLDLERVLRAAASAGVAVEINASPNRMDLDSLGARRAKELGVKIAVNSDAHAPRELADRQELGVAIARRGWLEAGDVLNTRSAEALLLRKRDRLRGGSPSLSAKPSGSVRRRVRSKAHRDDLDQEASWRAVGGRNCKLDRALTREAVDDKLRRRLLLYLQGADDEELAEALQALGGPSPEQRAFELLAKRQ